MLWIPGRLFVCWRQVLFLQTQWYSSLRIILCLSKANRFHFSYSYLFSIWFSVPVSHPLSFIFSWSSSCKFIIPCYHVHIQSKLFSRLLLHVGNSAILSTLRFSRISIFFFNLTLYMKVRVPRSSHFCRVYFSGAGGM